MIRNRFDYYDDGNFQHTPVDQHFRSGTMGASIDLSPGVFKVKVRFPRGGPQVALCRGSPIIKIQHTHPIPFASSTALSLTSPQIHSHYSTLHVLAVIMSLLHSVGVNHRILFLFFIHFLNGVQVQVDDKKFSRSGV